MVVRLKYLKRFPLDVRAVSAKRKVTIQILTTQEYFDRIEETTSINLAAKLTQREKIKSQVAYKRHLVSVKNKMAPVLSNFYEIGHHFS